MYIDDACKVIPPVVPSNKAVLGFHGYGFISIGHFSIDPFARSVRQAQESVVLMPREFALARLESGD